MASTQQGDWILDPFSGSSTTGIAANILGRRFLGIEQEESFIKMSKDRREELDNVDLFQKYRSKLKDIQIMDSFSPTIVQDNSCQLYGDLPF